jgi:hypothetical protein
MDPLRGKATNDDEELATRNREWMGVEQCAERAWLEVAQCAQYPGCTTTVALTGCTGCG